MWRDLPGRDAADGFWPARLTTFKPVRLSSFAPVSVSVNCGLEELFEGLTHARNDRCSCFRSE